MASDPGHSAIGGRGLSIVARLALRWGVHTVPNGVPETTVWAELALDRFDADAEAAESLMDAQDAAEAGARVTEPLSGLVTVATWDA